MLVGLGCLLDGRDEVVELLLPPLPIRKAALLQVGVVSLEKLLFRRGELHGEVGSADCDGGSAAGLLAGSGARSVKGERHVPEEHLRPLPVVGWRHVRLQTGTGLTRRSQKLRFNPKLMFVRYDAFVSC